jgi:hypothetical protein
MPAGSVLVVVSLMLATTAGGWLYFRRIRMNRPPIGVVNLRDALVLVGPLILMPYLYLALPLIAVTSLLAVIVLTALTMTLEPLVANAPILWLGCLALVGADIAVARAEGVTSAQFLLLNDVTMCAVVIGAASLWAQSGMKAREIAILAAVLTFYDLIATWHLGVMTDVFQRLGQLPLVPVVAWGIGNPHTSLRLGLGDLLMLTVAPLVLRKAFGLRAAAVAYGSSVTVVTVLLSLLSAQIITVSIPVMGVLGPMIVVQYWYWRRATGTERSTREYLRAEPLTAG